MIIALSPSKPDFYRVTSCSGQERIKMEIAVVGDLEVILDLGFGLSSACMKTIHRLVLHLHPALLSGRHWRLIMVIRLGGRIQPRTRRVASG